MIRGICILAGIAPSNVHLTHIQVNHHGIDGLLAVKRIAFNVVIANRVRNVDMILLDGLQTLDSVFVVLA